MPINVKKALHKASTLTRRGDTAAAAELYREILASYPQNRAAINGLAELQGKGGTLANSAPAPTREEMNRVVALYQRGLLQEAYAAGGHLARRFPEDPLIHNFLGVVAAALLQPEAAKGHYERAIALHPHYAEALVNLGICLQALHRYAGAEQYFQRAVELEPGKLDAQLGLAGCMKSQGHYRDAIAQYKACLSIRPDLAATHNNLGNCLQFVGDFAAAVSSFNKAAALEPGNADTRYNLGHSLFEQGRYHEACEAYRQALEINPGLNGARARLAHIDALTCNWQALDPDSLQSLGLSGEPVNPFDMLVFDADPGRQKARATAYATKRFGDLVPLPPPAEADAGNRKLRIGYFSADFHEHATMYLMIRLLELHDRSQFEVHAFAYGPAVADTMNRRVRACVDAYHEVQATGDEEAALLARTHRIDIAVDLKGYTQHGRSGIFAYRAAPLQISYLGYPGTLALPAMDYLIADSVVIPQQQAQHYTESIIYLPHSYQANDSQRPITSTPPSRREAGLPETGFVFCSFNNSYKITAREFDIWMRLLRDIPGSVLWLLDANEQARKNLLKEAQARDIATDRLVFAPRQAPADHLARHALADLFLDCFNVNAHTTASDALWAGLPVLTRPGQSFAARVGASLVAAAGLPELVATSDEDYEQLALALARDPARLGKLRQRLQANRMTCPLFNTERFTRDLERAYRMAWERHLAGAAPENIHVPDSDQCR